MNNLENYPDLLEIFNYTKSRIPDPDCIWYKPALGFVSNVTFKKGLVLGGTHSPLYIMKEPSGVPLWTKVPYVFWASSVRILVSETITSSVNNWLPFMESLAQLGESLVIITPGIENDELLTVFIVNTHKSTLRVCPILPQKPYLDNLESFAEQLADLQQINPRFAKKILPFIRTGEAPAKDIREYLPIIENIWIRTYASVAFPKSEETRGSLLHDIAIINVGGDNYDEQQEKLCVLAQTIDSISSR